jgi:hypothetical protein
LTLVDANPASIEALQSKVVTLDPNRVELVMADFNSDDLSLRLEGMRFDIVLAEACLPGQVAPISSLRKISNFVCDSAGMLVVTAADDMSTLSELCRRYMKPAIVHASNGTFDNAVEIACRVFGTHFEALPYASRSLHDWVLDQIVHPWPRNWALSMNDAIDELKEFHFLGSSPNFFEDWRWHKQFANTSVEWSELASKRWTQVAPYTMDNIIDMANVNFSAFPNGLKLNELCRKFGRLSYDACTNDTYSNVDEVENVLKEIRGELSNRPEFLETSHSITDYVIGLRRLVSGDLTYPYNEFKNWWGRGQQYVSFARKIKVVCPARIQF